MGGRQPVLLRDTDLDENSSGDREITHYLYGRGIRALSFSLVSLIADALRLRRTSL